MPMCRTRFPTWKGTYDNDDDDDYDNIHSNNMIWPGWVQRWRGWAGTWARSRVGTTCGIAWDEDGDDGDGEDGDGGDGGGDSDGDDGGDGDGQP